MMTFKQFLFLTEDRLEFLKKTYPKIDTSHDPHGVHKDAENIIHHFANHDPDPTKANTQWVINQYRKKNIRQEDTGRVHDTLSNFLRYKSRLKNKDINSYKHIADLDHALEPFHGTKTKGEEEREIKHQGAELIHSKDGLSVHKLKTKEAACYYGKGTKWCTAAENNNMFDYYNKEGPLYVVHTPDKRKHQFHFDSDQFADEQDRMHSLPDLVQKYPGLRNVKEFKSKHYAFIHPQEVWSKDISDDMRKRLARHGSNDHKTELLKHVDKLDHDDKGQIAFGGSNDHRSTLLKHFDKLDHFTKHQIAYHGNEEHRSELMKHVDKLDHDTIETIIRGHRSDDHISTLLKHIDKLSPATKNTIANYGNDNHRSELLKHIDKLDHETKRSIVVRGSNDNMSELLKHIDKLDDITKRNIAHVGNDKHKTELLKHIDKLDGNAKWFIAKGGNNDHRSELLKHIDKLRPDTIEQIVIRGHDGHKTELLKHFDKLHSQIRYAIAYHGNDDHRSELLKHFDKLNQPTLHAIFHKGNDQHREILKYHVNPK